MNALRNEPSCPVTFKLAEHKIGVTIALCILFVVSLLGNSLIAVGAYKTPTLRKPINFFIVNLAMSDLLFFLIVIPVSLVYLHLQSWVITEAVVASITCKVTPYLADVFLLVSVQSLVVIAVDRFVAVVFPLRVSLLTSKLSLKCIVTIWVVSMLVAIPHLDANVVFEYDGKFLCVTDWKEVLGHGMSIDDFYLGFATLFIYFPSALLILLYATIFTKLKSQKIAGQGSTLLGKTAHEMEQIVISTFSKSVTLYVFIHSQIVVLASFAHSAVNLCICLAFSGNNREGPQKSSQMFQFPALRRTPKNARS